MNKERCGRNGFTGTLQIYDRTMLRDKSHNAAIQSFQYNHIEIASSLGCRFTTMHLNCSEARACSEMPLVSDEITELYQHFGPRAKFSLYPSIAHSSEIF